MPAPAPGSVPSCTAPADAGGYAGTPGAAAPVSLRRAMTGAGVRLGQGALVGAGTVALLRTAFDLELTAAQALVGFGPAYLAAWGLPLLLHELHRPR